METGVYCRGDSVWGMYIYILVYTSRLGFAVLV